MALKIRLARGGAKKRPFYRIVVTDTRSPRDGRYLERVGSYNPMLPRDHEERVILNEERVKYWLGQGVQVSDRVHRFLGERGLMDGRAVPEQTRKNQLRAKALERLKEKQKAEEAARAEAEAAAAEGADGGEEAPAEA